MICCACSCIIVGIGSPSCLSLWERCLSAAKTERVNKLIKKRRKTLSVSFADSSPKGRAKGLYPVTWQDFFDKLSIFFTKIFFSPLTFSGSRFIILHVATALMW